jgi:hypothetical protein
MLIRVFTYDLAAIFRLIPCEAYEKGEGSTSLIRCNPGEAAAVALYVIG